MAEFSKLQIRAKVMSVISEIKSLDEYSEINLKHLCSELEIVDDKNAVFDIFVKEFIKLDEKEYIFAGCLLKNLINPDYMQKVVFELLKSNNYSDEAKYKLVQLLRIAGSQFDYNLLPQYFDNPQEMLDSDTKKLLENAVFNPEAMLDFLDFVSAVPAKDRNVLLESLKLDYSGDILANIVYPILYSDFDDEFKLSVINILGDSKSSLALAPFDYIIETSDNTELINACKTGLKKLKLAGASDEKADVYFKNIINDSKPAEFFTTIPDGAGNQAILISRVKNDKKYLMSAVVINDITGIVDCFGFYNITENEIVKIIAKFYQSEGKYKISPSYVKNRINFACSLTVKNKRFFPYEFICWDALLKDIEKQSENAVIDCVKNDITALETDKDKILTLLTKDYSFRWYIKPSENNELNNINNYIYNLEKIDIDEINKFVKENTEKVFDENTNKIWQDRLTQCCYLIYSNGLKEDAGIFKQILINGEYYKLFQSVLVQRSVFNYFVSLKEASKESLFTKNIFRKKQAQKDTVDIKRTEEIIELLKKNWING